MGYELLEKEPQEGTEDIIVNFIRPKYTQGILVELISRLVTSITMQHSQAAGATKNNYKR